MWRVLIKILINWINIVAFWRLEFIFLLLHFSISSPVQPLFVFIQVNVNRIETSQHLIIVGVQDLKLEYEILIFSFQGEKNAAFHNCKTFTVEKERVASLLVWEQYGISCLYLSNLHLHCKCFYCPLHQPGIPSKCSTCFTSDQLSTALDERTSENYLNPTKLPSCQVIHNQTDQQLLNKGDKNCHFTGNGQIWDLDGFFYVFTFLFPCLWGNCVSSYDVTESHSVKGYWSQLKIWLPTPPELAVVSLVSSFLFWWSLKQMYAAVFMSFGEKQTLFMTYEASWMSRILFIS